MSADPQPVWVLTHRRRIGDNIRAAREECQMSQERLGELADLDRKTINRIEQGAYSTLIDHLIRIAAVLNRPLRDLV